MIGDAVTIVVVVEQIRDPIVIAVVGSSILVGIPLPPVGDRVTVRVHLERVAVPLVPAVLEAVDFIRVGDSIPVGVGIIDRRTDPQLDEIGQSVVVGIGLVVGTRERQHRRQQALVRCGQTSVQRSEQVALIEDPRRIRRSDPRGSRLGRTRHRRTGPDEERHEQRRRNRHCDRPNQHPAPIGDEHQHPDPAEPGHDQQPGRCVGRGRPPTVPATVTEPEEVGRHLRRHHIIGLSREPQRQDLTNGQPGVVDPHLTAADRVTVERRRLHAPAGRQLPTTTQHILGLFRHQTGERRTVQAERVLRHHPASDHLGPQLDHITRRSDVRQRVTTRGDHAHVRRLDPLTASSTLLSQAVGHPELSIGYTAGDHAPACPGSHLKSRAGHIGGPIDVQLVHRRRTTHIRHRCDRRRRLGQITPEPVRTRLRRPLPRRAERVRLGRCAAHTDSGDGDGEAAQGGEPEQGSAAGEP